MPADASAPAPHYRRDIDGLRAVAILPVVLFHFQVAGFSGGFIGVDIFFVISGYLITGLITDPARPVGLLPFYARRIRRLLPAMAAMVAVITAVALLIVPMASLVSYGESLVALAVGLSNLYFWKALGTYFAPNADSHLLLHTWTLAVEEQFYLLFPPTLWVIAKVNPRWRLPLIVLGCLASLALAAVLAPRAPSASFYLTPTRAWQLLLGAALALKPANLALPPRFAVPLGALSLGLIVFSVTSFSEASGIPGPAALIPCLAAVCLIHIGEIAPANGASRLLALSPFVGVGLISYALYLWHWPIVVLLRRHLLAGPPEGWMTAAAIALSLLMAALSWFLIEQPLRRGRWLAGVKRPFVFAAAVSAALIATGAAFVLGQGLPGRLRDMPPFGDNAAERVRLIGLYNQSIASDPGPRWLFEKPTGRRVLIWGDSYALHLVAGLEAMKEEAPFSAYLLQLNACPPVLPPSAAVKPGCAHRNETVAEVIRRQHIDTVLMAGRWESYSKTGRLKDEQIARTVRRLQAMGVKVLIVGQPPNYGFDFADEYHYRRLRAGLAKRDADTAPNIVDPAVNTRLERLGAPLFDPTPLFCQDGSCTYRQDGRFLVRDAGHLTAFGSKRVAQALIRWPELASPK